MSMPLRLELREFWRIPFLRPVHIRPYLGYGPQKRLFSADLSLGGMYIRTPKPPREGDLVDVLLEAKGRALPFAVGEVAFSLPLNDAQHKGRLPGFGVRFTRLPDRSRALVSHLLSLYQKAAARCA